MKIYEVKTPKGTEVKINLEDNTVTVDAVGISSQPIQGWGVDYHEGKHITTLQVTGSKIIVAYEYCDDLRNARKEIKRARLEAAVPGVHLLQEAIESLGNYHSSYQSMMEDEYNDGVNPPKKPTESLEDLKRKYPRAALYLKADSYSEASHYAKSGAGNKAKKLLEDGGSEDEAHKILNNWLK